MIKDKFLTEKLVIGVTILIAKTLSKMSFLTTGNFQNCMKS